MNQNEEWRDVPDAPGYRASSLGRVAGPRGILKASPLNSGYLGVKVGGKSTTVHSAVMRAFGGDKPSSRHTVNYKNGIKNDNRAENLEWLTQAENNRHAVNVLGKPKGRPRKNSAAEWRTTCTVDLRGAGGPLLIFEPRAGYVSWRARNEAGEVTACAAIKTLLHDLADDMPRMMGARRLQ